MDERLEYLRQLSRDWEAALDPAGCGLPNALASDLAAYTGDSIETVLTRMARGKDDFKQLWEQATVNPQDAQAVEAFYRDQFVEAYELADWHSGRMNGYVPVSYAHAARIASRRGLRHALDFGSGIGSGALCLLRAGCEVDCADVANELLRFVKHRTERHGYRVGTFDLASGEQPPVGRYDLVTCFDVLEHVPDQRRKLAELLGYLKMGGCLVVNLMASSADPDRPMHVSSAGNWLALVRTTQGVPSWPETVYAQDGPIQVLVKSPAGRTWNLLGSVRDRLQGWRPDIAGGGAGMV